MTPPPPTKGAGSKRRLGKGMSVLFPTGSSGTTPVPRDTRRAVLQVGIEELEPNRNQPRKKFQDHSLRELSDSIAEHGLMQPILARKKGSGYEIIAGERRWRASQLAGLKRVDVIVKELSDDDTFVWALIENLQREDLNPIEEADAYRTIIDQRSLTQEKLAQVVGKDRSSVANALRLLKLPDRVRKMVADSALSMGHARALLSLSTPEEMTKTAQEVVKRGLSVRQVEKLVRTKRGGGESSGGSVDVYAQIPGGAEAVRREAELLQRALGTRVRFVVNGRKGKIEIDFSSVEELDRLIESLKTRPR
jgi:ParB family transcriptional regulator, chromosome partitioning protein